MFLEQVNILLVKVAKATRNPSLVRKVILAHIYEYKRKKLFDKFFGNGNKANSVVLASYPKSGNTLFRFIWMNVINELDNLNLISIDFNVIDTYLPNDQYFSDIRSEWPFTSLPCLIKTHRDYDEQYKGKQAIHLFRNPLDTMVSSYHYFSRRTGGPVDASISWLERQCFNSIGQYNGTFEEYIRENFDSYCSHFVSWMRQNTIPLSYESIITEKSQQVISDVFSCLGCQISEDVISKAIINSQREKVKKFSPSGKMASLDGLSFVRDGSCNQWVDYFQESDLAFVKESMKKYKLHRLSCYPSTYRSHLKSWEILFC